LDALKGQKAAEAEARARAIDALARSGYQAVRAAAGLLEQGPRNDVALSALKAAWARLSSAGDNATSARDAIGSALTHHGMPPKAVASVAAPAADLDAEALRRLAAPRARVTILGVGVFDFALFASEAPLAVLRFAQLAESGYYNGLTFHRLVPNGIVQGGSPGANEYVGRSPFMRDELGLWPHVRGSIGISTRGHDTGDAQFFIDLTDSPKYDHEYTVFGQVLNGMDVVDRILEGDVIERIEILP
jgi:cyclophilin family peptidyl-prolyl cis-trans isomerase